MTKNRLLKKEEKAILSLRELYSSYGYLPFKMSKFEEYDLYAGNKDFLTSDRVITFNDTDGRLLALKPDVTLSIVKNRRSSCGVHKVYYSENVYRVSGTTGQFKEIMQTGVECIGDIDSSHLLEAVTLAMHSLSRISESYVLDVSHMAILSALLDETGVTDRQKKNLAALISEKNIHGIAELCGEYGISDSCRAGLFTLVNAYGDRATVLEAVRPLCRTDRAKEAFSDLSLIHEYLLTLDPQGRVRFDFSVVNNMSYYNGILFKGFIHGVSEGVLSGGEYGGLVKNMGISGNAIGFAIYLDLLEDGADDGSSYDVDVLLLCGKDTPVLELCRKKEQLIATGKSVLSASAVPEKLRYRELIEFSGSKEGSV